MAAYTSSQDGYWDEAATWGGGGTPGDGDTATVNHEVTIRGDVTVGTDAGATTSAITINNGGTVQWDSNPGGDYTLSMKGRIDVNAGGKFAVGEEGARIPAARTATVDFGAGSHEFQNIVEGELHLAGAENYHMASKASQRAQLVADVVSGADRQFQVDADVDWSVGDVLWIGTGGDPAEATTGCEKVVVKTKVNASTYTADFVSDHYGDGTNGDMVVHASRNVTVKGAGLGQGFSFYTNATHGWVWRISWARFEYGGRGNNAGAGCLCMCGLSTSNYRIPKDDCKIQSTVFDEPGDVAASAVQFYLVTLEEDPDQLNLDEIHTYGEFADSVDYWSCAMRVFMGHVSAVDAVGCVKITTTTYPVIGSFWYCSDASDSNSARKALQGGPMDVSNLKVHRSYMGLYMGNANGSFLTAAPMMLKDGELFNSYYSAVDLGGTVRPPKVIFDNLDLYNSTYPLIDLGGKEMDIIIANSKLDGANTGGTTAQGAVVIGASGTVTRVAFQNCEFGLRERNKYYNVMIDANTRAYDGRVVAEKCNFKEPASAPALTYDWLNSHLAWAIMAYNIDDWRQRVQLSDGRTVELVECEIQDSSGVDQWSTDYPNTDRLALVVGGGEVHKTHQTNEAAGYIDGTFQRKLLPFIPTSRSHMTRVVPIRIPAAAGETITAKLSFNKNISQEAIDLPMVHLEGCGVYDEAAMPSDAVGSFVETSLQVVALSSGVLNFWVSCKAPPDVYTPGAPPSRTYVDEYAYAYPYDPEDASNLILYCDGFSVERS